MQPRTSSAASSTSTRPEPTSGRSPSSSTPTSLDHSRPPGIEPGAAGVRQQFDAFRAAFAGFRATILDQLADGDKVVTRKVFTGTHAGPFQGLEPTGAEVEIHVIDIVRVQDGRIVEHWNCVDRLGLLAQLGAVPATMP